MYTRVYISYWYSHLFSVTLSFRGIRQNDRRCDYGGGRVDGGADKAENPDAGGNHGRGGGGGGGEGYVMEAQKGFCANGFGGELWSTLEIWLGRFVVRC